MRQIVLDTETTGLDWRTGDRVIEIGCIELDGRRRSQQYFHCYLNPERAVDPGAMAVHGLTDEFLADKPKFAELVSTFLDFVRDAELIIHNASFDVGFLNNELQLLDLPPIEKLCGNIIDTLKMARDLRPGRKNNLNALCAEFAVDNSNRELHGALLDAELLADVYLAMTRGQNSLLIDFGTTAGASVAIATEHPPLRVLRASEDELAGHEKVLAEVDKQSQGKCLWSASQ
ncbi:MAG: DNA polymerase III subunit epsilon [Rhodocyclaceae bacterium]|nr:DNA polymerase III subunit epsilon [Rhodocyclaceae bacterium]MBL0075986.1 DNA polymerase III subunit epsilon [Rhodocyclaceae bacterium]